MFGDVGHGFLMLLFSLYLVLNEKALGRVVLNEMVDMCFGGPPACSQPAELAWMRHVWHQCMACAYPVLPAALQTPG